MIIRLGFIYGMGFEIPEEDFGEMDSQNIVDELTYCYAHQHPFDCWKIF